MTPRFKLANALAMVVLFAATVVDGFAPIVHNSRTETSLHAARSKPSPLLEEALSVYPFQFRPDDEKSGTKVSCSAAFNELARLYGDEEALAMVKIEPSSLRFPSDNFEPCLEAWTEQFGLESAQAMVRRNPGLLGIPPWQAEKPSESCMALSYVVAVTRPLPKILAVGGILAILTAGLR
eukprot:CAMPEP_0172549194 /NCGR_PEP_ID=MMETSP1067-20121228/18337_1 /TAXON_ID=265564 ORGANISM="Thalassiosira punctigera, Strain Tpunct2005C2" /NCGR_SAMPLE_ID=MMETSP1067 /ASSEMBLY_ACC=CAM_ASM_000444 /LENGTH=179 /DNA_ID=CAMNT_0013336541 /DNA_START=108 /DNA_END=647 /DNA_ORIENTATION=+